MVVIRVLAGMVVASVVLLVAFAAVVAGAAHGAVWF